MAKFKGVWGIFEYLDETTETIEKVRNEGVQPTVISPCPRHEIDHALGNPSTILPWIASVSYTHLTLPTTPYV